MSGDRVDPALRRALTDPRTGEMKINNLSNWFFGGLAAWALLVMAALFFNPSSLRGPDRSPVAEIAGTCLALFLVSMASWQALCRPYLAVRGRLVRVRNPIREYRFRASAVQRVTAGRLGYPVLRVAGRTVRVMGLQISPAQRMAAGSRTIELLELVIAEARTSTDADAALPESVESTYAFDAWTLALLLAWLTFASSFLWWPR